MNVQKPPATAERPERAPVPLYRPADFRLAVPVTQAPAAPVEKTPYVRIKKLQEAYQLIP